MGFLSSNKSWNNQAKAPGGMFRPDKRCPPIDDCNVKNFVVAGKRVTARGKKEIAKVAAQQKKERKAEAAAKKAAKKNPPAKNAGGWPFAGKYDPTKGKQRGR